MKKNFLTIATVVIFAIGFGASAENKSSNRENSETQTEQEQESKQKDSILGTYEVTDKVGCTIHITLNEDKTATITGTDSNGNNITYYCTWDDYRNYRYEGVRVWYGDTKKTPYLVFDGGDNVSKNRYNPGGFLKEGWYYVTINEAEAKDPNWRLKATKIK